MYAGMARCVWGLDVSTFMFLRTFTLDVEYGCKEGQ